jgi:acyl transferase domain-containing protein/NAD(P)-dependent dehydrogenase (short-subunit alcohol dehydrogenase family)/acyl carrier protein
VLDRPIVVFEAEESWAPAVAAGGGAPRVVVVRPGPAFRRVGEAAFEIRPSTDEDFAHLINALRQDGLTPFHVIHGWGGEPPTADPRLLDEQIDRGVGACARLVRALWATGLTGPLRLLSVWRRTERVAPPLAAAIAGFGRALGAEDPRVVMRALEIGGAAAGVSPADLGAALVRELLDDGPVETRVESASLVREARTWHELPPQEGPGDGLGGDEVLRRGGVYLLTGGLGGLGRAVAADLAMRCRARLVLAGRSGADERAEATRSELLACGAEDVAYFQADLGDRDQVRALVDYTRRRFGAIRGVIHAAGITNDGLLVQKALEQFRDVLRPKVHGTVWLDEALAEEPLDFFATFSSLAAVFGNAGQCDYGYANAFLGSFARWRETLRLDGRRRGRTVAIDWPWWREGGMALDERAQAALRQHLGLSPLETVDGLRLLTQCLTGSESQVAAVRGAPAALRAGFERAAWPRSPAPAGDRAQETAARDRSSARSADPDPALCERMARHLVRLLASENRLALEQIDPHEPVASYGIDSVVVMNITRALERTFGELPKTLLFEHQTLAELAAHFVERHEEAVRRLVGQPAAPAAEPRASAAAQPPGVSPPGVSLRATSPAAGAAGRTVVSDERIAIVGLAGRYPGARSVAEFWENLKAGRDCITEVPSTRWDVRRYYSADKDRVGSTYSKWGGFLDGVDEFDPLFFKIAPRDAAFMDPQERLFLQAAWQAMEDAGYPKRALEKRPVGVFVGVMWGQYQLLRARVGDGVVSPGSLYASVANRVSYCLDLRGPSVAVDTMCSSSLTALHLACDSLRRGECELAFAGGVNLSLHPSKYTLLSFQKFAASDGRCRAFGEGGDGYVPGEGVGAVLLKPLARAIEDGDHVYAVIRASRLNHGGKTSGFSVPNPAAQAEVVAGALAAAGVTPDEVSYVEAHGTGTALGDPIEIAGLTRAFARGTTRKQFCAIGSVKSNVGHLEAAAGVASLTKVLLQLQHRQLVPSIHTETLNPHIRFEETPFYVQSRLAAWPAGDDRGGTARRVAAISAFGAGGSNAHVVVEEWPADRELTTRHDGERPELVLLSAKTDEQLRACAEQLAGFVAGVAGATAAAPPAGGPAPAAVVEALREVLGRLLSTAPAALDPAEPLTDYGVDEVTFAAFGREVAERFGVELPVLLADRPSIAALAGRLTALLPERRADPPPAIPAPTVSLRDLAFTLRVGRDAFEHRLALVVSSLADLRQKLEAFVARVSDVEGVYSGSVAAAGGEAGLLLEGDEGRAYLRTAQENRRLDKLARIWVMGADVDWAAIDLGGGARRVSLPTYPFARERHWVDEAPEPSGLEAGWGAALDPRRSLHHGIVFEKVLRPADWIVADHRGEGRPLFPAAGVLELARAIGASVFGIETVGLRDVRFLRPLVVEEETALVLRLFEADAGGEPRFELRRGSAVADPVYACGTLTLGGAPAEPSLPTRAIEERLAERVGAPEHYDRMARAGLAYGPAFQALAWLQRSDREREALARIRVPDAAAGFTWSPAALDGALQTIAAAGAAPRNGASERALPFTIDAVDYVRPIPRDAWAHVKGDTRGSYDLRLVDDAGELCCRLSGVRLRAPGAPAPAESPPAAAAPRIEDGLHEPAWVPTALGVRGAASSEEVSGPRTILVVAPRRCRGIDRALARARAGDRVYRIVLGDKTRARGADCWEVDVRDPGAIRRALEARRLQAVHEVYFLGGWSQRSAAATDVASLERAQTRGVVSLFRLVKALRALELLGTATRLRVVSNDVYDVAGAPGSNPAAASLFGLTSAAAKEYGLPCSFLDLGTRPAPLEPADMTSPGALLGHVALRLYALLSRRALADAIRAEPLSRDPRPVAIHDGCRYQLTVSPSPLPAPTRSPFRHGGVYLIVGGARGIGRALAEHLARTHGAKLVIVGRSAAGPDPRELERFGAEVLYCQADVAAPDAMRRVVAKAVERFGAVHGVFHSAAQLADRSFERMTEEELRVALVAKVMGSAALWAAVQPLAPDFVVFFSSAQAFSANPGQANYAAANAFQDAFARHLAASSRIPVKVINWGYWGSVGAVATPQHRQRFAAMGVGSIEPEEGWAALERLLSSAEPQVMFFKAAAQQPVVPLAVAPQPVVLNPIVAADERPAESRASNLAPGELLDATRRWVTQTFAQVLKVPEARIVPQQTFEHYGMDSLAVVEIARRFERDLGQLSSALLYEHNTVEKLARHLTDRYGAALERLLAPARAAGVAVTDRERPRPVERQEATPAVHQLGPVTPQRTSAAPAGLAIVGVSGRYPLADDLHELSQLLAEGRVGVGEIPPERWDHRSHGRREDGRRLSARGGFVRDADKFDPLFFHITPFEAEMLDPQERLFLETAWAAIEDAGYTPERLGGEHRDVGVFVGVMNGHYEFLAGEALARGVSTGASSRYWSIANRVSYLLDFQGPSLAVDTACSSSLAALHLACESLRRGESRVAIVGGVNLILHPKHFQSYGAMGMLSADGRCKAFGDGADGIVLGEGVGAVVVKRLDDALRDGDHVYGIIRGTAMNAGGKTGGYTVPNPSAQAALVRRAFDQAGLSPRSLGYLEAHGTGTPLGDPIEIAGLTRAFEAYTTDRQFCALGSVKSNLGHLEAAAGMAGLTKVLLQIAQRRLFPTLHAERTNPEIDFAASPFTVQRTLAEWTAAPGVPRRAAVSSFGAGGANAHVIVDEPSEGPPRAPERAGPRLVPLSARTPERLRAMAERLLSLLERAVESGAAPRLSDLAFTLQTGRVAMDSRLAIVADDVEGLTATLRAWLAGRALPGAVFLGSADGASAPFAASLNEGALPAVAEAWVNGAEVSWETLHGDGPFARIPLPTYPFARERYWIAGGAPETAAVDSAAVPVPVGSAAPAGRLHPLVGANTSTLREQKYTTTLSDQEFVLRDHVIAGRPMIPAAAVLEIAAVAGTFATEERVARLGNVIWQRPIVADEGGEITFDTCLSPTERGVDFVIRPHENGEAAPYARGTILPAVPAPLGGGDGRRSLAELRGRSWEYHLSAEEWYRLFNQVGFVYGEAFRTVEEIWYRPREAFARLRLPPACQEEFDRFYIHPSITDGAFQSLGGLVGLLPGYSGEVYLPHSIGEVEILAPLTERCYAHVRGRDEEVAPLLRFDIEILSEDGAPLFLVRELTLARMQPTPARAAAPAAPVHAAPAPAAASAAVNPARPSDLGYFRMEWREEPAVVRADERGALTDVLLFDVDERVRAVIESGASDLRVCLVLPGRQFKRLDDRTFEVRPDAEEDYAALLDALFDAHLVPDRVLHLWARGTIGHGPETLEAALARGLRAALLFSSGLVRERLPRDVRLAYVYQAAGGLAAAAHASVAGLGHSLWWEDPRFLFKTVEIEGASLSLPDADLVERLLVELAVEEPEGREVRLTPQERLVRGMTPFVPNAATVSDGVRLRERGVYFITGGLGQLGLLLARHLARTVRARLVLCGSSPLDAEKEARLRELAALGGEAIYLAADLGDRAQAHAAARAARERWGVLHGMIHGAGVTRDGLLRDKTLADLDTVFGPKALGAVWLDEALADVPVDFCVFISSASSLRGNAGQTDYAAANRFLDAFALYREGLRAAGSRSGKSIALNWPLWADGRARLDEQAVAWMRRRFGIVPLATANGLRSFEEALSMAPAGQLAVFQAAAPADEPEWPDEPEMHELTASVAEFSGVT